MHICRTVHWDSVELVNRTVRRVVQRYLLCRPCDRIMIESWSNFNATVSHLIALTPATILTDPPRIIFCKYWLASPQFFLHLSITPHFRHTLIFCCNNCQPPDHRHLSYTGNFCITMASTLTSHLLVYGWALHVTTVNTSSRNSQAPLQEYSNPPPSLLCILPLGNSRSRLFHPIGDRGVCWLQLLPLGNSRSSFLYLMGDEQVMTARNMNSNPYGTSSKLFFNSPILILNLCWPYFRYYEFIHICHGWQDILCDRKCGGWTDNPIRTVCRRIHKSGWTLGQLVWERRCITI